MGIMDMFRNASTQPQTQQQQPAAPAADPQKPADPNAGTNNPANPLDAYAKLWEKSDNKDTPPALNIDPKVLDEVSGGLDFTAGLPPELMQQAMSGDSKAILEIIKNVGQRSYRDALHHSTALTDKYLGARSAHDLKKVQGTVRSELTTSALSSIPNASHPAVQHQLRMVAEQMQAQNPDARPEDIAKAAQQYILDLASAFSPAESKEATAKRAGTDWDEYFS